MAGWKRKNQDKKESTAQTVIKTHNPNIAPKKDEKSAADAEKPAADIQTTQPATKPVTTWAPPSLASKKQKFNSGEPAPTNVEKPAGWTTLNEDVAKMAVNSNPKWAAAFAKKKKPAVNHLAEDLTIEQIEQDILDFKPAITKEGEPEPEHQLSYENETIFILSIKNRYENFEFHEDHDKVFKILWKTENVQKFYSKILADEITRVNKLIAEKKASVEMKKLELEEKRKVKGESTFDLPVKYVRTRSVIAHDMSILHLQYSALGNKELKTYEDACDYLYSPTHCNNLALCFSKGSQPQVHMDTIQCNVCNTKPYKTGDLNAALFDHISSYAHAVNGISPPKKISKQLELTAKANLCAYYVNKEIPTNLAQQAAGHVIGHASSSIFMSAGNRTLTKNDLKYHPLKISGNLVDAEDNCYKSAAFSTFCMTQGMTSDQVKKMWSWQPLFLPIQHIKGKCGLCKASVENSMDFDKNISHMAKNMHLQSDVHKQCCAEEWKNIDKRLGFEVPPDVKCFLLSYSDPCNEAFSSWNTILSHIMSAKYRKKIDAMITPWQETIVIE